jgi:uncharacterized surface protein with fasciclin (FAS1) repeats
VRLIRRGHDVLIEGVQVSVADVHACNGVIHVIDQVLLRREQGCGPLHT